MPNVIRLNRNSAAVCLILGLSAPSQAAGISTSLAEPEPVVAATTWQGFHVGVRVGYGFGGDDEVGHRSPDGRLVASPGTLDIDGFTYGLRLGWRGERPFANRAFVYGVELGFDGSTIEDAFDLNGYAASSELDNLWGLRLKLGQTDPSKQTLFYGILGYVWGEVDYAVTGAKGGSTIALDTSENMSGFTIGLGVEHKLTDNISLTADWEYMELGDQTLTDGAGATTKATPSFQNIGFGFNYRF
jgi:outer membrane immunogenic protein